MNSLHNSNESSEMTASYTLWLAAHGVNASLTLLGRHGFFFNFSRVIYILLTILHSSLHMIVIPQRGFPLSKMYVYDW